LYCPRKAPRGDSGCEVACLYGGACLSRCRREMWLAAQIPYVCAGVVLMTVSPVMVRMSLNDHGSFDYNFVTANLYVEMLKILISLSLLLTSQQKAKFNIKESTRYAIPAAIYCVNNNLVFMILQHVNVTTFQLLGQLKTIFTGLLFRLFLGRRLTSVQYLAIWILACGTATNQIPSYAQEARSENEKGSSWWGLLLALVSCMLSSLGGIYSEKLLKDRAGDSIHWQNIQLYMWGVAFNFVGAVANSPGALTTTAMFSGFNFWAWMAVFFNAFNGLAISAILKYADNMARVFAHAIAMLCTMILSIFLFGESPTPQLVIAVCTVGAATVQYNLKIPEAAQSSPSANKALVAMKQIDEEAGTCKASDEQESESLTKGIE